jgi:hypothetical protein
MMLDKKIVGFVSEIDKMLVQFDETHTPSASQLAEMRKYQRIYRLRDDPNPIDKQQLLWEGF